MRWTLPTLLLVLGGCTPTVRLEVPAAPAVQLPNQPIAVVARARSCQQMADALVAQLASAHLRVDPGSPSRIVLFSCGTSEDVTLQQLDGVGVAGQRRTTVAIRAYAVAEVSVDGRVLAHLVGAGNNRITAPWQQNTPLLQARRVARRQAAAGLAADLMRQIDPLPSLVQRRVYPNAAEGTARALTTRAVRAEGQGDLVAAIGLAEAALAADPSPHNAGYLVELKRRLATR